MTGVFRTSDERVTVVEEKSLYPDEELVADIGKIKVWSFKNRIFRWFTWLYSRFEYSQADFSSCHVLHEIATVRAQATRKNTEEELEAPGDHEENN